MKKIIIISSVVLFLIGAFLNFKYQNYIENRKQDSVYFGKKSSEVSQWIEEGENRKYDYSTYGSSVLELIKINQEEVRTYRRLLETFEKAKQKSEEDSKISFTSYIATLI